MSDVQIPPTIAEAPTDDPIPEAPPPWDLHARAYVLLYRFPKYFVNNPANIPDPQFDDFTGGVGSIMFVRYQQTNVGPYDELIWIPGMYRHGGRQWHSIAQIYVSTMTSVVNGQRNWGIPKAQADFTVTSETRNIETIRVSRDGDLLLQMTVWAGWLPVPFNTNLMPGRFGIVQRQDERVYITQPNGHGWAQVAKLLDMRVNPQRFPDVSLFKPLAAARLSNVRLTFPVPRTEPVTGS